MATPPTSNRITQQMHGQFKAVDYSYQPDPTIYAPENGRISAYYPNAGDAGNNLQLTSGNRVHGFCHLERPLVSVGQNVKKGDKIGIMGYTGLTDPVGPNGRHLHAVLQINGTYVYPPSYYNEPFKLGDDDVIIPDADNYYWRYGQDLAMKLRGRQLSRDEFRNALVGNTDLRAIEILSDGQEAADIQHAQDVGVLAIRDNWPGQIYGLDAQVKALSEQVVELSKRPTREALDDLETNVEKLKAESAKVADCVTEPEKKLAEPKVDGFTLFEKFLALFQPKPKA